MAITNLKPKKTLLPFVFEMINIKILALILCMAQCGIYAYYRNENTECDASSCRAYSTTTGDQDAWDNNSMVLFNITYPGKKDLEERKIVSIGPVDIPLYYHPYVITDYYILCRFRYLIPLANEAGFVYRIDIVSNIQTNTQVIYLPLSIKEQPVVATLFEQIKTNFPSIWERINKQTPL